MKAAILAAGMGSRLLPLTRNCPKAMIRIRGKPLLQHQVESLLRSGFGYEDIYIVGGYKIEWIEGFIRGTGIRILYNPFFESMNNICSFLLTQTAGDDLLLMNADVYFDDRILSLLLESDHPSCILVDKQKKLTPEAMKVKLDGNRLKLIRKQLHDACSDGEFIGVSKFSAGDLAVMYRKAHQIIEAGATDSWYENVFEACADELPIRAVFTEGHPWIEIDDLRDYESAKRLWTGGSRCPGRSRSQPI